jgi:plasmid maintenance system antidote protein VapI
MLIKFGKQRRLATVVGVSPQRINDYLSGRRNASPLVAMRIGDQTATDPFIWLLPDNQDARRAAVAAWAVEEIKGQNEN